MGLLQKKVIDNTKSNKAINETLQAFFLTKLAVLVAEGFSLKESLLFLKIMLPKQTIWLNQALKELEEGQEFFQVLNRLGFSERISSQVYLAQIHGQFSQVLADSGAFLEANINRKKKLKQLLHYPMLLIIFMFGILFGIRLLLLPHFNDLFQENGSFTSVVSGIAIGLIYYFPYLFIGLICSFIIVKISLTSYFKRQTAITNANFIVGLPFFGNLIKLYYTYYFSYEWAQLFKSGYSMLRIIEVMKSKETTKIMQEVANEMEKGMKNGIGLHVVMEQLPFLKSELGAIIFHGELTSQLASELKLYGQICQNEFAEKIEKLMGWIQPLVFILVAFFILCIYLALLLPMFTMMEGIL